MDFGTQIGALRASQPYVRDLIIKMLQDPENFSHLGDLAIKRWEDAEPFYGDSSLAKTEEELIVELEEEVADALNYGGLVYVKQNKVRY